MKLTPEEIEEWLASELASEPRRQEPIDFDSPCSECGELTASDEGICYQCQCQLHAAGTFDMDGTGWR